MKALNGPMSMIAAVMLATASPAATAQSESPEKVPVCRTGQTAGALDFWLGRWTVRNEEDQVVGHNRIERALDGCAIFEHWTSALGGQGKSLFYYNAKDDQWRQVWVTSDTTKHYGLKHKELIDVLEDGSVRFQGKSVLPDGRHYLDRTTLIPRADGTVRQIIEISLDGGKNWRRQFDAIYEKKE